MNNKLHILLPEQWRILLFKDYSLYDKWVSQLEKLSIDINFLDWNDEIKDKDLIIAAAYDLSIVEFILRFKRLENLYLINNNLVNNFSIDIPTNLLLNRSKRLIHYLIEPNYYPDSLPKDITSYIKPAIEKIFKRKNNI